ncbi:MAG: SDR family NAD(P)-dependent oxidoreductase [Spirulinaceae cyanobacterium SM2_1_0]|nr:SDR family NAD(P)-dependent oxidoreductase [Spirulinaceae cyanobacterium SM2_1_0]
MAAPIPPTGNALVVGASGGIGGEFVRQLLAEARVERVIATCRQPQQAIALQNLTKTEPSRLTLLPLDITDEAQIAASCEKIQQDCPKLHCVINCVGLLHAAGIQPEKSLRQIEADVLLRYFQVNSIGAVLLAKHLLPLLRHGDRSIFAHISAKIGSIGDNRLGGWYGYRASKAALNMLMRTVAVEYSRKSPQTIVALLHPGTTATALSQPFQRHVPPEKLFSPQQTVEQLLAVIANLQSQDSGAFFNWDGDRLPW